MEINITMLGEAITFALLILFTMKFVWPPFNNMLDERAKRIADGLAAADKGRQELLNAESKVSNELKKVQIRATEIINNADKRANQIVEEAKVKAREESKKILADAQSKIEQEFMTLKEELRMQVASLVIKGTEHILRDEIDQKRHEKILEQLKMEL